MPMNIDMAKRLVDRRRAAGLSQEGLAAELGVSRQAISKWERSESSPDTDNLIALAQLYGVSLDELLFQDMAKEGDRGAEGAGRVGSADRIERAEGAGLAGCPDPADPADRSVDVRSADLGTSPAASGDPVVEAPEAEAAASVVEVELLEEPSVPAGSEGRSEDRCDPAGSGGPCAPTAKKGRKGSQVHISWCDGIHVKDGEDGDEVHVGWDGVRVNDRVYADWPEAHGDWSERAWAHDAAKDPAARAWRCWNLFPYPLIALVGYVLLGVCAGAWVPGLMALTTIPLYYALGGLVFGKRVCSFLCTLYFMAVLAWFIAMVAIGQPHPAWVAFLTVPLVTWLLNAISRWWRTRKAGGAGAA